MKPKRTIALQQKFPSAGATDGTQLAVLATLCNLWILVAQRNALFIVLYLYICFNLTNPFEFKLMF